jgi:hypothetical protein
MVPATGLALWSKMPDVMAEKPPAGLGRESFAPSLHAVGDTKSYDKRVAIVDEES